MLSKGLALALEIGDGRIQHRFGSSMPTKQKRDNDYYLRRLEVEHPRIAADLKAGTYASPRQAFLAAGLLKERTAFHEMKNGWLKGTAADRKKFLSWLKAKGTPGVGVASTPIAVDRRLQPAAKARIETIMTRRGLKMGEVMREMGFKALDASLGNALAGGTWLRPAVLAALETWLKTNAHV